MLVLVVDLEREPMGNKGTLTKIMAVAGTMLIWISILAPVAFAVMRLVQAGRFQFDYLMPAGLFPVVLAGAILLLAAALRARSYRALIGGSLGLMIAFLLAAVGLAENTGLASGAIETAGWPWTLVLMAFAGFWIALVTLAVGGWLFIRAGWGKNRAVAANQASGIRRMMPSRWRHDGGWLWISAIRRLWYIRKFREICENGKPDISILTSIRDP
ncbi:MAG: hypothetical protein ABSC61_11770 [Anaerolineales bacterium]